MSVLGRQGQLVSLSNRSYLSKYKQWLHTRKSSKFIVDASSHAIIDY